MPWLAQTNSAPSAGSLRISPFPQTRTVDRDLQSPKSERIPTAAKLRSPSRPTIMERSGRGDASVNKSRGAPGASDSRRGSTSASTSAPGDAHARVDADLVDPRCISDDDSAYESGSFISDTTSMNSEVTRYRIEHGRQYHGYKDGAYWVGQSFRFAFGAG
jgi:hypothetical protein